MLFDTPSAHEACPAAVTGMSPMKKVGDSPRRGVWHINANVRPAGTNRSWTL
jgi:hypothetical protein